MEGVHIWLNNSADNNKYFKSPIFPLIHRPMSKIFKICLLAHDVQHTNRAVDSLVKNDFEEVFLPYMAIAAI